MNTCGRHLLIELEMADSAIMSDKVAVEAILVKAAKATGATVLSSHFHEFPGGGVTGVVVCGESHVSIHTWPEYRYGSADIFLCAGHKPMLGVPYLQEGFKAGRIHTLELERGMGGPPRLCL